MKGILCLKYKYYQDKFIQRGTKMFKILIRETKNFSEKIGPVTKSFRPKILVTDMTQFERGADK